MNKLLIVLTIVLLTSCNSKNNVDDFQLAKDFYNRAKEKESEINIFFNISSSARGLNKNTQTYNITQIIINIDNGYCIPILLDTLPNKEELIELCADDIDWFGKYYNVPDSILIDSIEKYTTKIFNLQNFLKTYTVNSNTQMGKLIIFTIPPNIDVIYIPDKNLITNSYWKDFILKGKKFDDKWYYDLHKYRE